MMTLKAEKRDPQVKAKKLRREGFVTGVLYGKEMKENIALKFEEKEALRFMKDAKEGAQAALDIEGETVNAMVKNIDYDPMLKKVLALDFQALVAGEVVSATVPVHFLNEEIVQGVFEPELSEIHYKADPAHLLDPVEIDLAKLPASTKNMYVKDLKLEEKGVNVSTPGDTQLFHIADFVKTDTNHHGFELAELETKLTQFGFSSIDSQILYSVEDLFLGNYAELFLTVAQKSLAH